MSKPAELSWEQAASIGVPVGTDEAIEARHVRGKIVLVP